MEDVVVVELQRPAMCSCSGIGLLEAFGWERAVEDSWKQVGSQPSHDFLWYSQSVDEGISIRNVTIQETMRIHFGDSIRIIFCLVRSY